MTSDETTKLQPVIRTRRAIAGFLVGIGVLSVYVSVVGYDQVSFVLTRVSTRDVASLVGIGVLSMVVWGVSFHLVIGRLGVPQPLWKSILLFHATEFLNSITPFGQAGGDTLSAVLIQRVTTSEFETALVAIGTVNGINRIASVFLGVLGVSYLATRVTFGGTLEYTAVVIVGMAVVLLGLGAFCWRFRWSLLDSGVSVFFRVGQGVGRVLPSLSLDEVEIRRRLTRFVDDLEQLGGDAFRLGIVFCLGVVGQLVVAVVLWNALSVVGVATSLGVVLLIIPVAKLSGLAPTPGGFGSAEVFLTELVVATTGVDTAVASAGTLLYRATAFWIPMVSSGVITSWFVSSGFARRVPSIPDESVRSPSSGRRRTKRTGQDATPVSESNAPIERLLVATALTLVVLIVSVIHRRQLLVDPDNLVGHVIRDIALAMTSFTAVWVALHAWRLRRNK